jgi:hypothetical protein
METKEKKSTSVPDYLELNLCSGMAFFRKYNLFFFNFLFKGLYI